MLYKSMYCLFFAVPSTLPSTVHQHLQIMMRKRIVSLQPAVAPDQEEEVFFHTVSQSSVCKASQESCTTDTGSLVITVIVTVAVLLLL